MTDELFSAIFIERFDPCIGEAMQREPLRV
jgi:hypothetical protein